MKTIPEKVHHKELGEFLDLNPRRFLQLADEGIIPKGVEGVYEFSATIRGMLEHRKQNTTPAVERLNLAKAKREERKDRQESGDDIPAPRVVKAWEEIIVTVRERFLRTGNNVQSKIGLSEPQRAAIEEEVRGALSEFAKALNYSAQVMDEQGDEKGIEALKI